jgi:hypothetical protein
MQVLTRGILVWRRTINIPGLIRRAAIAACSAFAFLAAVACQNAFAQSGVPIRNIQVDVAPLRASVGDPTASWVQERLPGQLAKALAGRMSPKGSTLIVRIDSLTLGPNKDSRAWDNIGGVATIGGVQRPVRATSRYWASAIDQTQFEQSNRQRVTLLVQALAYWLARDL